MLFVLKLIPQISENLNISLPYAFLRDIYSGSKIPSTIRKEVIREWLDGLTRNGIANKNQIGAGTVSPIIGECNRQGDIPIQLNHYLFQVF